MQRNPFLNRSMIRSVPEFYGRHSELQRIMSRIGAQTPQSVSLVGERRMGKSSLLWHLSQPEVYNNWFDEPERYVFVFLDFQGQQHLDQQGFCRVFGKHLSDAAGERLEMPELSNLAGLEGVARTLERAGLQLVCLFDEFETVTRNAEFGAEFFGALRSLANVSNLAYITASRKHLQSLCHNEEISESPFFNIFAETHVGSMPDSEIDEMIAEPSAASGVPLHEHSERIRDLGGHLPFFVQIACSTAFECLAEGDDTLDPRQLERGFMEEASSHFHYLWDSFGEGERSAIMRVAAGDELAPEHTVATRALREAGYIEGEEEEPRPFSSAFGRFLQERSAREESDGTASRGSGSKPRRPAGTGGVASRSLFRSPLVYAWPLLAVVALGILYVVMGRQSGSHNGPEIVAAVQPGPPGNPDAGLKIQFYYRRAGEAAEEFIEITPSAPEARRETDLSPRDEVRLAVTSERECVLYAFLVPENGDISELTPAPLRKRAVGQTLNLPTRSWLPLDGSSSRLEMLFIAVPRRNTDLEDRYDQYTQVPEESRRQLRLEDIIRELAAARIEIPISGEAR